MAEALILDLDRTLVDVQTYTDYETAVQDVKRVMGDIDLNYVPATEWRSATLEAMAILVALSGEGDEWQRASDIIERHERKAVPQSRAMPGLRRFLERTQDRARCIATLMGPAAMDAVCDYYGIDVELRVGRRADLAPKPAPDQLIVACSLMGVDPADAVMIGDSTWDQVAAEAAGVRFIGLTNRRRSEFPESTNLAQDLDAALSLL